MRLRPILLTAQAIVLGSAVVLGDTAFSGLAVALIYGTFASTPLTMLVVPVLLLPVLSHRVARNWVAIQAQFRHLSII